MSEPWLRFRSLFWGSARPLSVGWWAVSACDFPHPLEGFTIPKGSLIRYREWYAQKSIGSNEGVKLTAEQIAEGIKERTPEGERIAYTTANPEIFRSKGGPSIAERMGKVGVPLMAADDTQVAKMGPFGGWDAMRARLVGRAGTPAIFCFTNCQDSIRTIPALQHDRDHPEEIDGESEIAAAHDWRFACVSRPYSLTVEKKPEPKQIIVGGKTTVTLNDLWAAHAKRKPTRL